MDADGSGARRLTDDDAEEGEPAWSPDGRWIAYVRRSPGTSIRELWLVRPDGSQRPPLTKLGGVAQAPAWSPDGRRLAFSAQRGRQRAYDIYTVGVDGTGVRGSDLGRGLLRAGLVARRQDDRILGGRSDRRDRRGERRRADAHRPENNDSSPAWRPRTDGEDD